MKNFKSFSHKFILYLLIAATMFTVGCGPAKDVKDTVDNIQIETTLPEAVTKDELSKKEAEVLLEDLETSFNALVLEINEKYNYKNYIESHPSPSKLSAGEMKSMYSYYNKIKKAALKEAETDFENKAKSIIAKISELDDKEKEILWDKLYEKNIAPLNDYIANLGK